MTGHAPSSPFTSDVSHSDFGSRIWDFLRFSLAREAFLLLHWAAFPISALSYPKAERPFLHVSLSISAFQRQVRGFARTEAAKSEARKPPSEVAGRLPGPRKTEGGPGRRSENRNPKAERPFLHVRGPKASPRMPLRAQLDPIGHGPAKLAGGVACAIIPS